MKEMPVRFLSLLSEALSTVAAIPRMPLYSRHDTRKDNKPVKKRKKIKKKKEKKRGG